MSNLNEGQNDAEPTSGKPAGNRKATLIRQGVLIAILLIVGGALAYDYLVARPAKDTAYEKAGELEDSGAFREDVLKELGEPSVTIKKQGGISIDQYNFRSGAIFRTYKVYLVYSDIGRLLDSTRDKEPEEMSLADDDGSEASKSDNSPTGASNLADSGRDDGGSNDGGRGGDPAQFVARIMENDADGDGRLSADEIPERMRSNLDSVDSNSDGVVDRDEVTAMVASFGERGRGNSNGEGSDRPQRPARPEIDE
jgi:hypothetical protein